MSGSLCALSTAERRSPTPLFLVFLLRGLSVCLTSQVMSPVTDKTRDRSPKWPEKWSKVLRRMNQPYTRLLQSHKNWSTCYQFRLESKQQPLIASGFDVSTPDYFCLNSSGWKTPIKILISSSCHQMWFTFSEPALKYWNFY